MNTMKLLAAIMLSSGKACDNQNNCWALGWRDYGTATAGNNATTCPAHTQARTEGDCHMFGGSNAKYECCIPLCGKSSFNSADKCPAGSMYRGETMTCHSNTAQKSGQCTQSDCCYHTCQQQNFTQSQCGAGLTVFSTPPAGSTPNPNMQEVKECKGLSCTSNDCCYLDLQQTSAGYSGKKKCWDAGFRDSTATVTSSQVKCPVGLSARNQDDGHKCGDGHHGFHAPYCFADDCCRAHCHAQGWRDHGDATGTHQCPATAQTARNSEDGYHCDGTTCTADECCGTLCSALAAAGSTCPSGKQLTDDENRMNPQRGGDFVDKCCFVGCLSWQAANNTCPAGKSLKETESCDGDQVSGCSVDKCCGDPGPCDTYQGVECGFEWKYFHKECDAKWKAGGTCDTAFGGKKKCQPQRCEDDQQKGTLKDKAICQQGLQTCVDCTPNDVMKCSKCVECFAGVVGQNYFPNETISVAMPTPPPTPAPPTVTTSTVEAQAGDRPDSPVAVPTPAPTANPTFAPTPKPTTPPLPAATQTFNATADLPVTAMAVVSVDITTLTGFPTAAPTAVPTADGYTAVAKQVVKTAVAVEVTIAVTAAEAASPLMKKSLEAGFANAIGVDPENVRVAKIGGTAVRERRRRQLAASTAIEFEVISETDDAAQVTSLKDNIVAAMTKGAVVANIQKEASTNGVLTAALSTMVREQTPTVTVTEATVTVIENVRPTPAPTTDDTFSGATSLRSSVSGAFGALALLSCTLLASL